MPMIECGACSAKYRVADDMAGKSFTCKKCGALVEVPAAEVADGVEPSMLDLALQKEAPKPKAPEGPKLTGDEAAFANLVSSVESGEAVRAAAPVAASPAAKLTRKQRKAVKAAARERAAQHADLGPSARDGEQERHSMSDWVGMMFLMALIGWVVISIVMMAVAYDAHTDAIERADAKYGAGNYVARDFPLGRMLLVQTAIPILFCLTVVPAIALGTWINNKIFNIRMYGSVYGTALLECSIPVVAAAVGMGIGALVGSGDGGIEASAMAGMVIGLVIGGLITIPAYWFICGYRFLEGLCGQAITRATGGVGGFALGLSLAMIFGLMAAADLAAEKERERKAENARIAQERQEREARDAERKARIAALNNPTPTPQGNNPPPTQGNTAQPAGPVLTPFEKMIEDLNSDSPTRRYAALEQAKATKVMESDLPKVEAALLRILGGPKSTREHIAALEAALHWGLIDAEPKLLAALRSDDRLLWTFAGQKLAELKNDEALDILLEKLKHSSSAADILRAYGDVAITRGLTALKLAENDLERYRLLLLVEPALTKAQFEAIKPYATSSETQLAQKVREIWQRLDPDTYQPVDMALEDIAAVSPQRQQLGFATLDQVEPNDQHRRRVNAALLNYAKGRAFGIDAEGPLPELFGKWHDRQTVEELKTWLDEETDPHGQRRTAMLLLSTWQEPGTLRLVQAWLLQDSHNAVPALQRYGQEAEGPMLRLLNKDNEDIAVSAIKVLEVVGGERSLPRLRTAKQSSRPDIAAAAESAYIEVEARVLAQD